MRAGLLLLIVSIFLFAPLGAMASSDVDSDASAISPSNTPLFDYRYNQVVEDLGLLKSGTSESKLGYGSIETASLNPLESSRKNGCRLTIKQADTESDTCGSTCGDTCMASCQTCVLSCGADTCGSTCSNTCANTCGAGCGPIGQTVYETCAGWGATCGSTCSSTCANTCKSTCGGTCGGTCSRTCALHCGPTIYNTCYSTCLGTCAGTCLATCSATCGPKCPIKPVVVPANINNSAMAKYSKITPSAAEQNALLPYNFVAYPPGSVYYMGIYVPWAQFGQTFFGDQPMAWVETDSGWDVAAKMPKGTWVREFIYIPSSGDLESSVIAPTGQISNKNYDSATPGYKYLWFYAEMPGTYVNTFQTGGSESNSVAIHVF